VGKTNIPIFKQIIFVACYPKSSGMCLQKSVRFFLVLLIALLPFATPGQQLNQAYNKALEDKIRRVENSLGGWVHSQDSLNYWNIQQRMAYYGVKGASIAVIENYKMVWAKGYGMADVKSKKPVTPQTLFQAGSISKSVNAVGVLKLVQDEKLDLNEDINQYLQTWNFPYDSLSKGKKITLAHLLSHSAGLTVHGFPGYANGDTIPSVTEVLDGIPPANTKAVRSAFEPGVRFKYSGGGTTISQMIVQDITNMPYDEYMWQNVLQPLSMTMSSYTQPPAHDQQQWLATGYRANGKEVDTRFHVYPEQAAAGLWTNPTDLCKYIIETQLSLKGQSNKVLNTAMTHLRLTPYIDSSVALGVFIDRKKGEKYFGHNGADEGFLSAYTGSFENGNGVVVMVNSDNGKLLNEVINSVAIVYGWKGYYAPVNKKLVPVTAALADSYAGDYLLEGDTLTISRKANAHFLTVNRSEVSQIYFSAPAVFFSKDLPLEFTFTKDAAGKVTGIYFKEGDKEMRAKKL